MTMSSSAVQSSSARQGEQERQQQSRFDYDEGEDDEVGENSERLPLYIQANDDDDGNDDQGWKQPKTRQGQIFKIPYTNTTVVGPVTALLAVGLAAVLLLFLVRTTGSGHKEEKGPPNPIFETLQRCNVTKDCYLFVMHKAGLCSQLINLFAHMIYARQVVGRSTFIVDETNNKHHYERLDGTPVLEGYFTPLLTQQPLESLLSPSPSGSGGGGIAALINDESQRAWVNELLPKRWTLEAWYNMSHGETRDFAALGLTEASPVYVGDAFTQRKNVKNYLSTDMKGLYLRFVDTICPALQFNPVAWKAIQGMRRTNGIPTSEEWNPKSSVSFHIRRTDKLIHESELYEASTYVEKLLTVTNGQARELSHCFLATDDSETVVPELQAALDAANMKCCLYFTPLDSASFDDDAGVVYHKAKGRYRSDATLTFLAEFSVLLESTYFVGTYNSNVGCLVSVLRACPGNYHHDATDHYGRSYGVDTDDWFFR